MTIFTFLNTPLAAGFPQILDLYLKDVELLTLILGFITPIDGNPSLLNCYRLPEVFP